MKILIFFFGILFITNCFAQNNPDFDKMNDLYYNMSEYAFNGFSANLEIDMLEELKNSIPNEDYKAKLDAIHLSIVFFNKDSIEFNATNVVKTENEQFNQGLSQVLKGAEESIKGFFQTWSETTFSPAFEPNKYNYNVNSYDNLTQIEYIQEEMNISVFLSDAAIIDSIKMKNENTNVNIYPKYQTTSYNKRIIETLKMSINNMMEAKIDIDYVSYDEIMIPSNVVLNQKMPGFNQVMTFKFSNIVLL